MRVTRLLGSVLLVLCPSAELAFSEEETSEKRAALPAWSSTLQCLAPLAREVRWGEKPVTMDEVFFDGPFLRPQVVSDDPVLEGFRRLTSFDDREAERQFRDALYRDATKVEALLGLAMASYDDRRRAACFLAEAEKAVGENSGHLGRWYELLTEEYQEADGSRASDLVDRWKALMSESGDADEYVRLAFLRQLSLWATEEETAVSGAHWLEDFQEKWPGLKSYSAFQSPEELMGRDHPTWARIAAGQFRNAKEPSSQLAALTRTVQLELHRLKTLGSVMPESSLGLGRTGGELIDLLSSSGETASALQLARRLTALPYDGNSIGTKWKHLQRDDSAWAVGRKRQARLLVADRNWEQLREIPRGFQPKDRAEWFAWQVGAALETEGPFNHWLAALRREPGSESLVEEAEAYLAWHEEGPVEGEEAPPFPGLAEAARTVPEREDIDTTGLSELLRDEAVWDLSREAIEFSLPNWKHEPISLSSFRGKPVVVIFFLGGGCLHCVEQLTAFGPWAERYREAGIELLAISTDPVDILQATLSGVENLERDFPIPVLSDENQEVFREWRVYDEFDGRELHGTFLIDESGRMIWEEKGNVPYMHPDYLLTESKRLLSQAPR